MANNNSNDPLKKELPKKDTTFGIYGDPTGRALGGQEKALGKQYKTDDGDQYWTGGAIGKGQRIDPRTNWLYEPTPQEREAEQAKELQKQKNLAVKTAAENKADIGKYDPTYLASVAKQLNTDSAGAVGFLKRMGVLPTKILPTALQDTDSDDGIGGALTRADAVSALGFDPETRAAQDSGLLGSGATFNLQDFLSNRFGPGGKVTPGGTSFFGTPGGKPFAGERPEGLAGLQQAAPDQTLASFMKMFGGDITADRRKELEEIFAMLQGITSMQPERIGPQTQAYRNRQIQYQGGF